MNQERKYKDLSPRIKEIFGKFGFKKVGEPYTGKPYYFNIFDGKVYNVRATNKLKAMSDGAKPDVYGTLQLKTSDGHFKTVHTHRIAGQFIANPNPQEYNQLDHLTGLRDHNAISELAWTNAKENIRRARERKKAANKDGGG